MQKDGTGFKVEVQRCKNLGQGRIEPDYIDIKRSLPFSSLIYLLRLLLN